MIKTAFIAAKIRKKNNKMMNKILFTNGRENKCILRLAKKKGK